MILYFLFLKIRKQILEVNSFWKILLQIFIIAIAVFYGWIYSLLDQEAHIEKLNQMSPIQLLAYTLLFFASYILLRTIFPVYKVQTNFLPKYYPLSTFQQYSLSLSSDFITPQFLYFFILIISSTCFMKSGNFIFLFTTIFTLISAKLIQRFIQYYFDNKLKFNSIYILFITIFLIILEVLFFKLTLSHLLLLCLFSPIYFFICGYLLETMVIENKKKRIRKNNLKINVYLKLFINNPKIVKPLIIGFSLKFIILLIDVILYKTNGSDLITANKMYWLFASPIIIFTYVFNNILGFTKNSWLNYELRTGEYIDFFKFTIRLLIIPIIIDAVITLPLTIYRWGDSLFILTFYFISLLFLISISMVWSILSPVAINSIVKRKGKSSFVSVTVSMISVLLLSSIRTNKWSYLLIPIYLIISILALFLAKHLYEIKKYSIFEKLTKK